MSRKLHLANIIIINEFYFIENAAILLEDSKIVQVGTKEDFGDLKNYEMIDHGDSLICPGFINLHTHLLYSNFEKLEYEGGLFPWLEKLVVKIAEKNEKDFRESVKFGIEKALSTGTTFLVENTPSEISAEELSKSPLRSLIGIEIFGSEEEQAETIFNEAIKKLFNLNSQFSISNSQFVLSPHAAYDVSKPLWEKLIQWSKENNKPLLTHLEESPEERLWWQEKCGAGIDFWKKINKLEAKLKYWKQYKSGVDFLNQHNLLSESLIATHLCQATKSDLIALKENNVSLVHCPRSNYYLSNGLANLYLWDQIGINWGVGTDSITSNENLDLIEEVKFTINHQSLYNSYKISNSEAFKAITSSSAKVLKKENEIGSLKPNSNADFLIYDISNQSNCTYDDPYHLLIWFLNKENLKEVYIGGEIAWSKLQ